MKVKIEIEDFLQNQVISNIKVNNGETKAAFIVSKGSLEKNSYEDSFWLINLADRQLKKVNTEGAVRGFKWQEDFIIYFVVKDGNSIFYKYCIGTESSEELFSVPMVIGNFLLLEKALFFTRKNSIIERIKNVEEGTELPFYVEGAGLASEYRNSLYSYSFSDGNITKITEEDIDVQNLAGDREGKKIAFISAVRDKYIRSETNLYVLDTETQEFQLISKKYALRISNVAFIDSETIIFTGADLKTYGRQENQDFYIITLKDMKEVKITDKLNKSFIINGVATDSRFGQTGSFYVYKEQVFFLTVENNEICLNQINKKGEYKKIFATTGTIDCFCILKDSVVFVSLQEQQLQEIYLWKEEKQYRLTYFNREFAETHNIIKPEKVSYINEENIEIQGFMIKPSEFKENQKYPAVVCIHGGPKMIYLGVYYHMMQLLAAKGYFVLFCNPRGSSGNGNEFDDIRGNFASSAFDDIMGFTEAAIKKYPSIDKTRLGVMGGSYGGYMTNYIITHTDMFSAAVAERGISNLTSMLNTSDIGYVYIKDYMGDTDMWSDMKAYLENSPIVFADKIKTPTLFIHGKKDNRCNYTEALQLYSAMKYFGIEAKFCLFEEENHSLEVKGKPINKVKRFKEILEWLNKYL